MAKDYKTRPSEILNLRSNLGDYEAYCFDECCSYILSQIRDGKEPAFETNKEKNSVLEDLIAGRL